MWLNQNKTFSRNEEEDWRLTVPPGGSYKWGGVVCAIPQGSRHKEAAWELIRFLTMSEESARFGKETENSFFLCSSEKYATEEYKSKMCIRDSCRNHQYVWSGAGVDDAD